MNRRDLALALAAGAGVSTAQAAEANRELPLPDEATLAMCRQVFQLAKLSNPHSPSSRWGLASGALVRGLASGALVIGLASGAHVIWASLGR